MTVDLERAHALDALMLTDGWRLFAERFAELRDDARSVALAVATEDRDRAVAAARYRALDSVLRWPGEESTRIYHQHAKKERVSA